MDTVVMQRRVTPLSTRPIVPLLIRPSLKEILRPRRIHTNRFLRPYPRKPLSLERRCYSGERVEDGSMLDGDVQFDLAHCIALAGCSFDTYTDPESCSAFAERTANGTSIVYTDRDFVQENFQGLLQIHLKGASHLPARDFFGKSDSYVHLSIGRSTATSQIIAFNHNPEWNETFYLYIADASKEILTARAYDADVMKSDDALGAATFPLKRLSLNRREDFDLELKGDGGGGILHTTMELLPFDASLSEVEEYDEEDIESMKPVEGIGDLIRETLHPESSVERSGIDLSDCPTAWKALAVVAGKRAEELFDPVCFVENFETDTQVWVYRNVAKKECVIAFRGTEQFKWRDLVTDTDTTPAVFDIERSGLLISDMGRDYGDLTSDELLVHRGFLKAYDSVRKTLFFLAEEITSKSSDWTIYLTGHSLGGALATLCAYEMACRWLSDPPQIKMYNFGSPRVGNRAFAHAFNEVVSESWRIVCRKDLVTTVPRLAGYRHVNHVVKVDSEGSLYFNEKSTEMDHLEGKNIADFLERMSFEEIGKVVLDYEMELMKRLMDGSGLEEHMETNYLKCLQCSIQLR